MRLDEDAWFDREYNTRIGVPDHVEILARFEARSAAVRRADPCFLDVPYGDGEMETLDIFPARGTSRAVLVFIHGGYWRSRDKSDFSFLARGYARAGVTTALVNYALCPAVSIEHIVRQMLRAHAWLWRNVQRYGGDPARIHVCGHSAGGHLAAMMAACDWPRHEPDLPADLVRAVMSVSGIHDLVPLLRTAMNADLRLDDNSARVLSPITYLPSRAVAVHTVVGGLESAEFHRQNRILAQTWPHCFVRDVPAPGLNHFTVVEALGDPASCVFAAALAMMGLGASPGLC
jgi:arylformamidase